MRFLTMLGIAAHLLLATPAAQADTFPSKPIRLIVAYSPGGALDNIARVLAKHMEKHLPQPVVVENRPGGNNLIAARALLGSAADGHTLMLTTNGMMSIAPVLYADTPFDPLADFTHLGLVSYYPYVLVSGKGAFADLPAALKKAASAPDSVSMAYTGHVKSLSVDLLGARTGSKILKIPYKGDNDAISDLVAGRVDIAMLGPSVALPLIESGKLDALAVTTLERFPMLKDVPTVNASVPGYSVDVWTGLIARAGVPAAVADTLQRALRRTLEDPAFQARLTQTGDAVLPGEGPRFRQRIQDDLQLWRGVMKDAGLKPIKS